MLRKSLKLLAILAILSGTPILPEYGAQYVPIAGENVNLREGPSLEDRVVTAVSYGILVKIVQRSTKPVTIGNHEGFWTQIETPDGKRLWIFDQFLGLQEHFSRVTNMKPKLVHFCSGDYCPTIRFSQSGVARHRIVSCLGGDCTLEQHIDACHRDNGFLIIEDPRENNLPTCEIQDPVYRYKNIYRFLNMYFINLHSKSPCIIPDGWKQCWKQIFL